MPGAVTYDAWYSNDRAFAAYSTVLVIALAGTCLALAAYVMQRRDVSYVNR
jgi:hypothetical protein